MSEPLLKPVERSRLETSLAHCANCGPLFALLKAGGRSTAELEALAESAENVARGMLEVDKIHQVNTTKE